MPQIAFVIILLVAFALLLTEKLRNDIVAVLIIISLYATGVLEAEEALSGFSSEPAIVVVAIFVLSAALHQTGLSEMIGTWIARMSGSGFRRAIAVIMPLVALLSAFTHHLTTTAMMLPVTLNIARERDIPPSRLLMPLSFAASLGTTITIIGAPAFIIASEVLEQAGRPGLSIFSIAPIGIAITVLGTLFIIVAGPFLLPSRGRGSDAGERYRLADYFTEVVILENSPFAGKTVEDLEKDDRYRFKVVGHMRGERRLSSRSANRELHHGDVLLVRTNPDDIIAFRQEPGVELLPVEQYREQVPENKEEDEDIADKLVQAVIAPGSDLVRRTIAEVDFRRRYGAIVISIWRRSGWLGEEMSRIRLREGDVLVLQGDDEALERVASDSSFLLMVPFQGESRPRRRAPLAGAIMLGTIMLAAFGIMSIEMAMMTGAIAMILTRCINASQAYRAIDARIFVFIAGAIPLGLAMQKSGTLNAVAEWMQGLIGGWSQLLILATIFTVVAVLTQFMSDAATTALFAPLAVTLAQALGHAPEAYAVTVAMAAVASFLTPIGHHGNLLVYGPGNYQFTDFVRVGTPLTIIVGIVVVLLTPILWSAA